MKYERWRSRKIVDAKPLEQDGGVYDPRTGQTQKGVKGDYWVKDGNKTTIVEREHFLRNWERLDENTD